MTTHMDYEELVAGAGLDSLEPDDDARLQRHLATCEVCRDALSETLEAIALSASLQPETPPPYLRARILAAAAAIPQTAAPGSVRDIPKDPARLRSRSTPHRFGGSKRTRVLAGVLAFAAGIAAAVPITLAVSDRPAAPASAEALVRQLIDPSARQVTLTGSGTTPGPHAKAVLSAHEVVVVAEGLPANDRADSTYVLWAASTTGVRVPVGTFDVGKQQVVVDISGLPYAEEDINQLAISVEPGRRAPETPSRILLSGTPA